VCACIYFSPNFVLEEIKVAALIKTSPVTDSESQGIHRIGKLRTVSI
jgi:hypothetical protein